MRKDLSFYSQNFVSSDGKDYKRFKEYKHQVNQTKTFIELRVEKKSFFLSQKNEGHHAFLRIDQDYRSNNFNSSSRKILYLEKEQGGGESSARSPFEGPRALLYGCGGSLSAVISCRKVTSNPVVKILS